MKKLGEIARFSEILKEQGISYDRFAELADISARTVTNTVHENKPLGIGIIRGILKIPGVSINWVLTGEGEKYLLTESSTADQDRTETKPKKRDDRETALDFISMLYKDDPALAVEIAQGKHDLSDLFWRKSLRDVVREELVSLLKEKGLLGKVEG